MKGTFRGATRQTTTLKTNVATIQTVGGAPALTRIAHRKTAQALRGHLAMPRTQTTRQTFDLLADGGEPIPAILQLPAASGPVAGVLLLHGFSSRKERMADSIGRVLVSRGVASLSIDLPLYGAREGG